MRVGGTESKEKLCPAQLWDMGWCLQHGSTGWRGPQCEVLPRNLSDVCRDPTWCWGGREDFLSAAPPLHLTPGRGLCWAPVGCNQGDALPELLPGSQASPLFLICFSHYLFFFHWCFHYHVHKLELKLPETGRRKKPLEVSWERHPNSWREPKENELS